MAKLSILGAQRVKALIEVLKDKEKEAIREINEQKPSEKDVLPQVHAEFGVQGAMEEVDEIKERLRELSEEIESKIGKRVELRFDYSFRDRKHSKYSDRVRQLYNEEADKKIAEIKKDFRQREQKLWLCETLEEAKDIVGME